MTSLSVRELNSNVSRALARVRSGETIDITSNGETVAQLGPKQPLRDEIWLAAHNATLDFLREGLPLGVGKITEDDKYGDARL